MEEFVQAASKKAGPSFLVLLSAGVASTLPASSLAASSFWNLTIRDEGKNSRIHRPDGLRVDDHIIRLLFPSSEGGGERSAGRGKEEGRGRGEEGSLRNRRQSRDGAKRLRPSQWARERGDESTEGHGWDWRGGWEREEFRAQKVDKKGAMEIEAGKEGGDSNVI